MPNANINHLVINGVTKLDLRNDTITPADLAQGVTAHDASGAAIVGTMSGGGAEAGTVTQDAQGYLVLDDDAPSGRVTVEALSVMQNGTYTAPSGKAYSPVTVNVSGGGGGGWVRPSNWPDLAQMDVSAGDILYMTSYADEGRGFCRFRVICTGSYTVEVGTISGSMFTAESTHTYLSDTYCDLFYGSQAGGCKVLRVTGTAITQLAFAYNSPVTIDGHTRYTNHQGIVDIVGKLPHGTGLSCNTQRNLVNVEVDGLAFSGSVSNMFNNCTSLVHVDTSTWNTSSVTSMSSMFSGCNSLTSLDVSGFDTGSVTYMSSMFYNCYSLTSLDVSGFDTGSVTSMSSMFYNCYSLTSLDVSGWDTSSVTTMSSMFCGCSSLASLDVSRFNTSSVTTMSAMFRSCDALRTIDTSAWNTSSVTTMSSMFYYCHSLTYLDVSNWDTSSVTDMSYMFYQCESLTFIDVSGFDTSEVTNMTCMFYACRVIAAIDVSGFDFSKVTTNSSVQQLLSNCSGLCSPLTLPATVTMVGNSMFSGCYSLSEWHFLSTTPPTLNSTNAFSGMTDYGGKKIYVPAASLSAYQTATNWSTYASYMVGE